METFSEGAIEIINELHTERLDYTSEYLPLINAAQALAEYEETGLRPEEVGIMRREVYQLRAKLADYERAEEEGRILPCKVGGRVWEIEDECNFGYDCHKTQTCYDCEYREVSIVPTRFTLAMTNQIGKTVFLTTEEATDALKERGNT